MAKGHLLITPPNRSDEEQIPRESCFRQFTIADAAILLSGLELAFIVGYLLHLTTSYDAQAYPGIKHRVDILLIVVPVMIAVVMLSVFGIVGKRLWMIVPNIVAQLLFVAAFIAAIVYLGGALSSFQLPPENAVSANVYNAMAARVYGMKVYLALSIVGLILSLIGAAVLILCFLYVYKLRNVASSLKKHENGY